MDQNSIEDWISAANERAADAEALLRGRADSIGSVYLAGYAIECCLKAYLRATRKPVPTRGSQGHNLTALWHACGFRKVDIADAHGCRTFYVEQWSTDLRYEIALDYSSASTSELVSAGRQLAGMIQQRIRRSARRRR
jgi:HEPN domain-containing protein